MCLTVQCVSKSTNVMEGGIEMNFEVDRNFQETLDQDYGRIGIDDDESRAWESSSLSLLEK